MKGKARIFARSASVPVILLAFFASVVAAGCSKAPADATIKSGIEAKFYADPALKSTNLQVVVTNRQVMLAGEVPSQQLKDRAEQLAKATPGVSGVEDRIAVATAAQAEPAPAPAMAETALPRTRRAPPRHEPDRASAQPAPRQESAREEPAPTTAPSAEPGPAERPEPAPAPVTIPAGTHIAVRMIDSVDSSKNKTGQMFRASLDQPIVVGGKTVVPAGANITIRLAEAKSAGKISGSSELELQLVKMTTGGKSYPLVSNSYTAKGKSRGKDTAKKVGIGAAAGAVIGAIAGGGKGAAIGAGVGAGAGTAVQLATRGQQVKVPSETLLDFVLQQSVTVTEK
jgi:hypothetical protein